MADAAPEPNGDDILMELMLDLKAPQPKFAQVIEQGGCVVPNDDMVIVFDRENVDHVLRHHELFSSAFNLGLGNVRPLIPLNVDPPVHSKYRKLLDPLFAPKRMDERQEDITRRVNALIDTFIDDGTCNFSEQFAEIFPSSVFLGLMGLPEEDLRMFLDLRDGILHPEKHDPGAMFDPEVRQSVLDRTGQQIYDYFGSVIDDRTAHPSDDVISRFIAAEVGGEKLSREDILDILFLFLIAGLDTVSDTLTCSFAFLAQHPEHRRRVAEDPACIPAAVEELLRWESPVPFGVPRLATQDTELPNGCPVKAGTAVQVIYGGANIDPSEWPDGMDVRFDREVNRHIAFGGGVHRCLGSHLALRELRITFEEWHRRIPDYWLTPGHDDLEYPPGLRHVKDLMLSW